MRTFPIVLGVALLASAVPALADYTTYTDASGDETALVPVLGAPWPAEVVDCNDPSVDIVTVSTSADYYVSAWVSVDWIDGPRECNEVTHARRNEYRVTYEPRGAVLNTEDGFELRATRDADGWRSCAVILFADGTESRCFGWWGGLSWSFYPQGFAPYGDWNGYRAYDLRGSTYDVEAVAWSTIDDEPGAFTIVDMLGNMTTQVP